MSGQDTPAFDPAWLQERFPYDVAATNKAVEVACQNYFQQNYSSIHIVDAGSGTGSNFLHLYKLWPEKDQHWSFLEEDALLNDYARQRLLSHFKKERFQIEEGRVEVRVENSSQKLKIRFITGSLLEIGKLVALSATNLLTASAVFDLFSKEQFELFFHQLHQYKIPLLARLNYHNMYFDPPQEKDAHFIHYYEAHMSRLQHFGRGMGKSCTDNMKDIFAQYKYNWEEGKSIWHLDSQARNIHGYLMGFMEEAIGQMVDKDEDKLQLQEWLKDKRALSKEGRLKIVVEHFDLFTWPKQK